MEEHGLTEDVLNNTDVLIWWGHMAHDRVSDEVAERVVKRVWDGMGFIVLHSAHLAKQTDGMAFYERDGRNRCIRGLGCSSH